jgi:DNA end-binding protein Ku
MSIGRGKYVSLEPQEIKKLRVPSRQVLEVTQFVDVDDIDRDYFEKPYFSASWSFVIKLRAL